MLILIAEDDANLRRGLADLLALEGFECVVAENGVKALEAFARRRPDFCIFDVAMPEMNGFELCRAVRARNTDVPILFLTARNEEIDRLLGFGHGGDDYLAKPFSARELVARIQAILRRMTPATEKRGETASFTMGDLTIDAAALRAFRGDHVIDLTRRELGLLRVLYDRAGLAVSRDELYERCWGWEHYPNSRALDQVVATLRRKVERDPAQPCIIATVHGVGYRYDP